MTRAGGRGCPPACLLLAGAISCACGDLAAQAVDTLIVEVRLDGVGSTIVLALPATDPSEVRVAPAAIFALAGLEAPPQPFVTIAELQRLLGVDIVWLPARLLVAMRDPRMVLPASRQRYDRLVATSRGESSVALETRVSGPFVALTLDERAEYRTEVGYALGNAAAHVSHSSVSGTAWALSASPVSRLWISYRDGDGLDPAANVRLALGHTWVSADYATGRVVVAGATALGPFVLFASTRAQVVTWRGPVHVQVGRTSERATLRMTYGPVAPSPFAIPIVR